MDEQESLASGAGAGPVPDQLTFITINGLAAPFAGAHVALSGVALLSIVPVALTAAALVWLARQPGSMALAAKP